MIKLYTPTRASWILIALSLVGFQYLAWQSLVHWDICFDSDYAMVALAYRDVALHGLRDMYMWSLGYLGTIAEIGLGGWLTHLWGAGPWTMNLAPYVYMCALLVAYLSYLNLAFGRGPAALALVALVFSGSSFYVAGTRSWPNYPSSYFLGFVLWGLYHQWQSRRLAGRSGHWVDHVLVFSCAALMTFGYYMHGLFAYYVLPIVAHLLLSALSELGRRQGWRAVRHLFWGGRWLTALLVVNTGWALISLWLRHYRLRLFGLEFGWNPGSMLVTSVAGLLAIVVIRYFLQAYRHRLVALAQDWTAPFLGLFTGYLPALIYRWQGGPDDYKHLALRGSYEDFARRSVIFHGKHHDLWNLGLGQRVDLWLSLFYAALVLGFMVVGAVVVSRWFWRGRAPERALAWTPLLVFLPTVFGLFLWSNAVVDAESGRYLYALLPFYAAVIGIALHRFSRLAWPWPHFGRALALAVLVLLSANGLRRYQEFISSAGSAPRWQRLIAKLEGEGVYMGYADYWFAYPVTFLTYGRIVLEPLYSSHIRPYRGYVVANQTDHVVAYIPGTNALYQPKNGIVTVAGKSYTVSRQEDLADGGGVQLYMLQP